MFEKILARSSMAFRKPWIAIGFAVLLTVVFAFGIPKLTFDSNIKSMIPEKNRDRVVYDYYEDESRFGSSDMIFVGVETADVYTEKNLTYVKALKDDIEALNRTLPGEQLGEYLKIGAADGAKVVEALRGVGINKGNYKETLLPLIRSAKDLKAQFGWDDAFAAKVASAAAKASPEKLYAFYENPIDKTQSIVNADYIANEDDALVVKKLVDDEEITPEAIAGLQKRLASWEIYQDAIVSKDGKLSLLLVKLNSTDNDVQNRLTGSIEKVIAAKADPAFKIYLDGEPVLKTMISRSIFSDIKLLLPIVAAVIGLILFLCFRKLIGVLYPAAIILVTAVFTMGLMAYCNVPISIISTTVPVLLIAIVSAYGIHQMNHYLLDHDTDKLAILNRNMKNVGLAITLSAITVMVGFGALAVEDFVPIKNFGIFTAIGDMVGVFAALYVLPALILVSKKPKRGFSVEATKGPIASLLHLFVRINRTHSKLVILVAAAVSAVFLVGSFFMKTELNNVSFFKKGSVIHQADDYLNEKLAGTMVLNVVLDTDLSDPYARGDKAPAGDVVEADTPAVLAKIEAFEKDVKAKFPYVTKVNSFNTVIKKMNQEMNDGDPAKYAVPADKQLISQYLLIFSGDIRSVISDSRDKLRVSLTMKRVGSTETEEVRDYCQAYFDKDFLAANHLQAQITGTAHLYSVANTLLVDGMIKSIVVCIIIVFLLLVFILKDLRMSLIAITPIAATILIEFGVLGIFGIPLNVGTAIVSSIAIGIGVDFSIHFITWYRHELQGKADIIEALENSIIHKGRAILYNMVVIVGGFIVLAASNFVPLIQFGSLVAACMVLTALGSLVVVPAIIRVLAAKDRRFLYLGVLDETGEK